MGGNTSQLPRQDKDFPYFTLTFQNPDKIKLVNADSTVVQIVESCIRECWSNGIQRQREEYGEMEFKFSGNPFAETTFGDSAYSVRVLLCAILQQMRAVGWHLLTTADLRQTRDLSTWFFERRDLAEQTSLTPANVVAVAISGTDKLALTNAPEWMNEALVRAVGPFVQSTEKVHGGFKVKIEGRPWLNYTLEPSLRARNIIINVFRQFSQSGYRYLGTCNPKGQADTIFFINDAEAELYRGCTFAAFSLNSTDKLRLMDLTPAQIAAVRDVVTQRWYQGMQDERPHAEHPNMHEFKLYGTPWRCSSHREQALHARRLISTIMSVLLQQGLSVVAGLDVSRKPNDKGVFILRSCAPVSMSHVALAPLGTDKLATIDMHDAQVDVMRQIVQRVYTTGLQEERHTTDFATTFKLKGRPWSWTMGNDDAVVRLVLCHMLHQLSKMGYHCICAADVAANYVHQENGPDYPLDCHTMFFVQVGVGHTEAAPPPPSYDEAMRVDKM